MSHCKKMPMPPDQVMLFAQSVDESLSRNSDVRFVGEAMDLLDWSAMETTRRAVGCPPYPARVLCKILVYGYSKGIRSSRALEDAVGNDKRYIWLAGGLVPDHSTISRFRKDRYRELKAIYAETVRLCAEAGLVLLKTTSTDGTKIASRASMRSFYDAKRLDRESEAIEQILREAEEVDGQEDEMYGSGKPGELPDDLVDKKARLSKLSELAAKLKESGRSHISSTDERAHLMKTSAGIRPAYNVQLTVDSAESVIVAADVTTNETDNGQLAATG